MNNNKISSGFSNIDYRTWSTEGQDGIVNRLFKNKKKGVFIDAGCWHPIKKSNTYLLYQKGWKGIGIDGSNQFKKIWKFYRPKDLFICSTLSNKSRKKDFIYFTDSSSSTVDKNTIKRYRKRLGNPIGKKKVITNTLENILYKNNIPKNFDFLNVDVEGHDMQVLQGLNLNIYRPKVIMIEIRHLNLNRPIKNKIFSYLGKNKYSLIAKTPQDAIFVSKKENLGWLPKELL